MDIIEKIDIALRANGGNNMANCRCEGGDQLTPPFHCEFCAIRNALLEAKRHLTSRSSRAANDCAFRMLCNDVMAGCAESCLRYRLPPA